jgi:hypothetical protein
MKKYIILLGLSIIFFSCPDGHMPTYHTYYKSFFLADTSFVMDGEIFDIVNFPNEIESINFDIFIVKTDVVDGWEIIGTKKSENKYELTIDVVAGNTLINKETINRIFSLFFGIIPVDFPICTLKFSIDDFYVWQPSYRQPRDWDPQQYYKYDYLEYMYVYVAETLTISEQRTFENYGPPWNYIDVYHYDLDFSKPGWYKICIFNNTYNNDKFKNDAKHKTGRNTNFYL